MNTDKLLGMLLEAIDYSFLQTNGDYEKSLTYPVIDKIRYIKEKLKNKKVKEMDLDSDIRTYLTNNFNIYEDGVLQSKKSGLPLSTYDIIKASKHFFELGLNAQKE